MESWVPYGIIASLAWGVYIVIMKVATSGRDAKESLSPRSAFFAMSGGILLVGLVTAIAFGQYSTCPSAGIAWAIAAGALWGIGMGAVTLATADPSIPVAKLAPLYNTNTLIALLLGAVLLNETSEHLLPAILGAVLVVLGGIIVGRPSVGREGSAASRDSRGARLGVGGGLGYVAVAVVAWGSYGVLLKVAVGPQYLGCNPFVAFAALTLGVAAVAVTMFAAGGESLASLRNRRAILGSVSGIVWALGLVVVLVALYSVKADISRLVPLYNTNTLVATVLGIVLLREVPNARLTVLFGALLVVLGGGIVAIG